MDLNNEQNRSNAKLMIWFCGTLEWENIAKNNLKSLKSNNLNIKTVIVDGLATRKNRSKSNKMRNDKGKEGLMRKAANTIGNPVGIARDLLNGYEEAAHLVQLEKALEAINNHIEDNPNVKTDLIVGGYSRGAAVALPAFLGSISENLKLSTRLNQTKKTDKTENDNLFEKHFKNISVIAVDPVPGINKQDTFGLETLSNKENPLKEVFETLNKELKETSIDVTYIPSNYDLIEGLKGGKNWNKYTEDPAKGVKTESLQIGVNHLITMPLSDHRYEKGATPRGFLNRVIESKLGIPAKEDALTLEEMHKKIKKVDRRIIKNIAIGPKIPRSSELLATATRGALKSMHFLGGPQGKLVNLNSELTDQLKNPEKPKIVAGRPMDADKMGLELNVKNKLVKKPFYKEIEKENNIADNMLIPIAELNETPLSIAINEAKESLNKAEKVTKSSSVRRNI